MGKSLINWKVSASIAILAMFDYRRAYVLTEVFRPVGRMCREIVCMDRCEP